MRQPTAADSPSLALPWRAVLLSLTLHALLIATLSMVPDPGPLPARPVVALQLLYAPDTPNAEAEPEAPVPSPEPEASIPEPDPSTPERAQATLVSDAEPVSPDSVPDVRESAAPEQTERTALRGALRTRLLEQIAERDDEAQGSGSARLPWTGSGEPVPGVPGRRGWLSGYVGRVAPERQRWQSSDGTQRARYVLVDGTVVCTQRRAPTFEEMMQPWKSTALTLGSICGRERPEAPDFSNPRTQPPPGRRAD